MKDQTARGTDNPHIGDLCYEGRKSQYAINKFSFELLLNGQFTGRVME